MTKRRKWIMIQILIWFVFWGIDMIKLSFITPLNYSLWVEIIISLLTGTVFFYSLVLFALPRKAGKVDIIPTLLKILLTVFLCLAFRRGSILFMAEWFEFKSALLSNINYFMVSSFDIFLKFGTYAGLVWFFLKRSELQKQMFQKELDEERLQNELLIAKQAVIKAQINPHFLFNTLHFIHSKALIADDNGLSESVLLLSDVLRHTLKDNASGRLVPVNDELEHIKKLYAINKLRFSGRHYLQVIEQGAQHNQQIPPLIMLTFFENAMKHGLFDEAENPVILSVTQTPSEVAISLKNKIKPITQVNSDESFAIGKQYVEDILARFYPNNHILAYHIDGEFHTVDLKIYGQD